MSSTLALELESALRSSLMSAGNRSACVRAVKAYEELVAALRATQTVRHSVKVTQMVTLALAKAEGKA